MSSVAIKLPQSGGYTARWVSLAEAAERLVASRQGMDRITVLREFWSALGDGEIGVQALMRDGQSVAGRAMDRFMFRRNETDENIAQAFTSSEIVEWDLWPPAAWQVEVLWEDVTNVFALVANRPNLVIHKSAKRVLLFGSACKLTPRSLDLLRMLADGALEGEAPVPKRFLEDKLFRASVPEKGLAQAIDRLKRELKNQVLATPIENLIENFRAQGYRLNMAASDISILD